MSGNVPIEYREAVAAYWRTVVADTLPEADLDRFERELAEHLAYLLETARPHIRASWERAEAILAGGRFKNQFETGTSAGFLDPELRVEIEQRLMGYPSDHPAAGRPIYGYLSDRAFLPQGLGGYGQVVFRLKEDLKARTTFTIGDSIDDTELGTVPTMYPSWVETPEPHSVPPLHAPALGHATRLSRFDLYAEAQYHGGVSTKDLEAIILEESAQRTHSKQIARLKELAPGIRIEFEGG